MSKLTNWLLLGVGGYAVYYYARLGFAGSNMEIVFKGVSIQSITNYTITLTIQNVSNATLVLSSLSGTVTVNDNSLGNISSFKEITIQPNSQQDINITMDLSLLGIPGIIQDIINNVGGNYEFVIAGHANVNNLVLPFNLVNDIKL